jgi:HlyD family secretion protein
VNEINNDKKDLAAAKAINLDSLQINLKELNYNVFSKISDAYSDYTSYLNSVESQRASYAKQKAADDMELEQARIQYENSRDKFERTRALYEMGAASKSELDEAKNDLDLNEYNYNTRKASALSPYQLREAEANLEAHRRILRNTIITSIQDLEKNIRDKQRKLVANSEIVADTSGRILELRVKKGDLVQTGSVICTIAAEETQTDALEAVIYVPVDQGKKIKPGMEVNVIPSTVKKEEYGSLLGNVSWVSEYPASAQGMALTLGNNDLVRKLSGGNTPLEVRIKLVMDSGTVSHYKWSTPEGPPLMLDDGTICTGEVKVGQRRPISMVMPFIKKLLPF